MKKREMIIPTSLKEIIKVCTNKECDFIDLDEYQKQVVLLFIKNNNIECKVFDLKGFDILKQLFFVLEYIPGESVYSRYRNNRIEFENFCDYYNYLKGDIFDNACYFGYSFTEDDLKLVGNINSIINRVSFSKDTIEKYTLEEINNNIMQHNNDMMKQNQKMKKWLDSCPIIISYDDLLNKISEFDKKFCRFDDRKIFFDYIVLKNRKKIKNAIIKYASSHSDFDGISFDDILYIYGKDAAQDFIEKYTGNYSISTIQRHKAKYKNILKLFGDGKNIDVKTIGEFSSYSQRFRVRKWLYKEGEEILFCNWSFLTFDEMAAFLNNDLSDCDLSEADSLVIDSSKYIFNEGTRFPKSKICNKYVVNKGYDDKGFYVDQLWFDDDENIINRKEHRFTYFCDFYYFLHGDLSNSDMIMCDGIENIIRLTDVNFEGMKVRSDVAKKIGIAYDSLTPDIISNTSFPLLEKNEIKSEQAYLERHFEGEEWGRKVSYVTDIHLSHRFLSNNCQSKEDCTYVVRKIIENISNQSSYINLIGGDITSNTKLYKNFIRSLSKRTRGYTFVTLGNHELWGFEGTPIEKIIDFYRTILSEQGFKLVHNNLFIFNTDGIKEIKEFELKNISVEELRKKTRDAFLIIFGGIGFSGKNNDFNANNAVYMNTINRQKEVELTNEFDFLYKKVSNVLSDKNVIILTHMPIEDWAEDSKPVKGFIYINGHNHHNYYFDDGLERIYRDNQIGYKKKEVSLKHLLVDCSYDWFSDYDNGIYEISKKDYEYFYRGIGEGLNFNREFQKLYMLKKEGTYMFLMKSISGTLLILNGGAVKKAGDHSVEYFYENLSNYSKSIKMFLSKYEEYQKSISNEIKLIGGSGIIHGCIIDIDLYNHLYINPFDGSITPYYAKSIIDKFVYNNLPSLLKNKCPELYGNYVKLIENSKNVKLIKVNNSFPVTSDNVYIDDTEIYKISRVFRALQFTSNYNIVRMWNDDIVTNCSAENGRLLVEGLIFPEKRKIK